MKKIWLWALVVLLLLVSIPGLVHRWTLETKHHTYELVIPYEELMTSFQRTDMERVLQQLRKAGVNTVSFQPLSLSDLEQQQRISIYSKQQLLEALRFGNSSLDEIKLRDGYYVPIPENSQDEQWIQNYLHPQKLHIADNDFYFISERLRYNKSTALGYDPTAVQMIEGAGMQPIFRMDNTVSASRNQQLIKQLLHMKQDLHTGILFSGEEVSGYPDLETIDTYAKKLSASGFLFYTIEFAKQKGLTAIAKSTNYAVIRQHSLDLNADTLGNNTDRAIRAIKERNIRSLFIHISDESKSINQVLAQTAQFSRNLQQGLPEKFVLGHPTQYAPLDVPLWAKAAVMLAGILFIFLVTVHILCQKNRILLAGLLLLLAIVYFLTQQVAWLKAFTLLIAIVTPITATMFAWDGARSMLAISFRYLQAICVTVIGIVIVTSLLNNNGFITGFELFRGVKLVYIIPILAVAYFVCKAFLAKRSESNSLIQFLHMPVTFWHLLVIGCMAVIGLYYISRTGNGGSVSGIELYIRQALEEILYTRPRTKEVLIGFPAFIAALYAIGSGKKWGRVLLIPASIGFLSTINTFTHFHIPLFVSTLRSFYGILFGYIVGVVIIFLCKWIGNYWNKYQAAKSIKR